MTPIRPPSPQALPPSRPAAPAADARSAFFQAVKGPAAVAPIAAAEARPQPPALAATRLQMQPQPAPPTRNLRPGSLLDIKV